MIMCAKEEDDGKVLKWTLGLRVESLSFDGGIMIMCAKEEDDGKVLKWTLGLRVTLLLKFMDKVVAVCTFVIHMEFKMLLAVLCLNSL
ncbi:hypothetical protein MRB53_000871 [Persea americana]|uniref:Uncharacterized protein n=1 Tax=Persea americana TaxID=3435 RepID=A0ACC2MR20_PERAE|nr:hypothetical protein MRB53_000871 [Persea americana]